MTNDHTKLAGRLTEAQVLAMRVIGMTDAESLTCIPQADGMLVVSAMDDDGKTYALDLQSLFKALAAEPEAPVPNPTDTARALVDRHAMAVRQYWALNSRTPEKKRQAVFAEALDARAALLAHVAGVEQRVEELEGLIREMHDIRAMDKQVQSDAAGVEGIWRELEDELARHQDDETTRPTEARDDG